MTATVKNNAALQNSGTGVAPVTFLTAAIVLLMSFALFQTA
jgi:hypothetical protein